MSVSDQLEPPSSAEVFEKFLCKKLKDPMQRYTYMRLQDSAHLESIFKQEFDPEVFLAIIDTFTLQVVNNPAFNNAEEQTFVAKFIILISKTPKFEFMLDFMEERDHTKIKTVLAGLALVSDDIKGTLKNTFASI